MHKKLQFGRQAPKDAVAAWGARAIFKPIQQNPMVDILWDRQDAWGPEKERQDLVEWVRKTGLPSMEVLIDKEVTHGISMSQKVWHFVDGDYEISASPQGSGGYLYLGAWKR